MSESQFREAFREEAQEHLTDLENTIMELEERLDDEDLINRAFRSMHTLKGSSAMFDFTDISAFTHNIETVFMLVRDGKMKMTKEILSLSMQARDQIKYMLNPETGSELSNTSKREELTKRFKAIAQGQDKTGDTAVKEASPAATAPEKKKYTYRIRFRPHSSIFMMGTNPILLVKEVAQLGRSKVVAHTDNIPFLDEYDTGLCYIFWDIILTTDKGMDAIKGVFVFVEDDCELKITVIDESDSFSEDLDYKKLGEILLERGDIHQEDLDEVLGTRKLLGDMLVDAGLIQVSHIEAALVEQEHIRQERQGRQRPEETISTIKVPAEKLDRLVNLVGELVTVQARLTQMAVKRVDYEMLSVAEEVERLSSELRDNTMNIRMLPIGTIFNRFKRVVRDLSNELKKEVEMTTEGEATELDKTVIEKLNDPLVHLIRNSIDHGIETPDVRAAAGKPRRGTIHLSAEHSGAHVLIHIRDDGMGLDKEAIRLKGIERGLINASAELSDNELFSLIFAAGFSTAKEVTSVSGRGVGMDVVRRAIESLRGSIELNSVTGKATIISIKLPLTLAIIDGLLVKVEKGQFVLPLASVIECVSITAEQISRAHDNELVIVRGEIVPYISLRKQFYIDGKSPELQQVVITEVNGARVGFLVDHVVGEYQTVIKKLGGLYKNVIGMSGATILGDGSVAIILDVPRLIDLAKQEQGLQTNRNISKGG
ncbi:MAG: chemotaxis protein CheA [Nitrospirae bacterium]|nr:chemotaxis protein CheA [Nitrospirota bacterium]